MRLAAVPLFAISWLVTLTGHAAEASLGLLRGDRGQRTRLQVTGQPGAPAPRTNALPQGPLFQVLTNALLPGPAREPAPGLYSAWPYSMLVLVPPPVDPGMLKPAPRIGERPGGLVEPRFRLIPKTPPGAHPLPKTLRKSTQ